MRMVEYITYAGCRRERTVGCFLDVEKAFDSVWHDGLLFKLREVQPPDCYLHLVASFLTERTFCVRVGDSVSFERRITAGVSVLASYCSDSTSTTYRGSLESRPSLRTTQQYLRPIFM